MLISWLIHTEKKILHHHSATIRKDGEEIQDGEAGSSYSTETVVAYFQNWKVFFLGGKQGRQRYLSKWSWPALVKIWFNTVSYHRLPWGCDIHLTLSLVSFKLSQ